VVGDDRRAEEAGEFKPAVTVGRCHHGNLDLLVGEAGDASRPFAFDHRSPLEFETEFAEEVDRCV